MTAGSVSDILEVGVNETVRSSKQGNGGTMEQRMPVEADLRWLDRCEEMLEAKPSVE